jgi:hypothetical protein
MLDVAFVNTSHSPLVLSSITAVGHGLGTTIRHVEIEIAPAETGNRGTPGGAFETDPPVAWAGTCGR